MAHTTNYMNTFIEVAEDCKSIVGTEPPLKDRKSVARIQYELLTQHPYQFTSDELLLEVYLLKNQIAATHKERVREKLFSKGQACMRASALGKTYGWGIHYDTDNKMAIYPVESEKYKSLKNDVAVVHTRAMRSSRR